MTPAPELRYRAAVRSGELPRLAMTRRNLLWGSVLKSELPARCKLTCFTLLIQPPPRELDHLAHLCSLSPDLAQRALRHAEQHGWIRAAAKGWVVTSGADCDCPVRPQQKRAREAQIDVHEGQTALYRLYDAADCLLYVGISDVLTQRMRAEAKEKPWWNDVTRKTVAWYGTRPEADFAETLAIAAEGPVYNISKRYTPRPATRF